MIIYIILLRENRKVKGVRMQSKRKFGPQKIIGISIKTTNENDKSRTDIGACFERFYGEDLPARIPNKTSEEVFAIYTEYEGNYTQPYRYILGCPVESFDDVPEGFVTFEIPAKEYAFIEATGEMPRSVVDAWKEIWKSPLEREYSVDFELYGQRTFETPPTVEIYLSVKS